jgi:hypothetical protein
VASALRFATLGELARKERLLRLVRPRARGMTCEQLARFIRVSPFGPEVGRFTLGELFAHTPPPPPPRPVMRPGERRKPAALPAGCPRSISRPRPKRLV